MELTKLDQIKAAEERLLIHTYDRNPILFTGGEGVHIIDEHGAKYLDLLSGIGVNALGYNHPVIIDAIARQSRALIHTSNLYYHEGQAELALRLTERTGMDRCFFSNSGTEAWEGALKLARAHAGILRAEGKQIGTKFLALDQSFHGRTFGSMATTYKDKYREPFAPVMPGVEFVKFNDVEDLRAKFSNEVCAILVEAIQGEGGVRPMTQEFRPALAAPASSAHINTTTCSRTSPRSPSHLRAAFPWAPCSARKRCPTRSIQVCTGPPSAATCWLVRWPSP
jgi:acetylornithine aminotransferase/acetylornithine/N-succinyldiaminopimelate aminotransferase